jgi:hypothetical protein
MELLRIVGSLLSVRVKVMPLQRPIRLSGTEAGHRMWGGSTHRLKTL